MSPQPAPTLTFSVERYQDCTVVHCHGRLVSGLNHLLNAEVNQLPHMLVRVYEDAQIDPIDCRTSIGDVHLALQIFRRLRRVSFFDCL